MWWLRCSTADTIAWRSNQATTTAAASCDAERQRLHYYYYTHCIAPSEWRMYLSAAPTTRQHRNSLFILNSNDSNHYEESEKHKLPTLNGFTRTIRFSDGTWTTTTAWKKNVVRSSATLLVAMLYISLSLFHLPTSIWKWNLAQFHCSSAAGWGERGGWARVEMLLLLNSTSYEIMEAERSEEREERRKKLSLIIWLTKIYATICESEQEVYICKPSIYFSACEK